MPNQQKKLKFLTFNWLGICVALVTYLKRNQASSDFECGTVNILRPHILGGIQTLPGEWPFITSLFNVKTSEYFCGGTLISVKHVLTAAHCIHGKSWSSLSQNDISVRIGAYNLTATSEVDTVHRNVSHINIHDDWNVNNDKYDADIAILVLSDNVTFTKYIRPVCMPPDDFIIDGTIDVAGFIVGWGLTENGTFAQIPNQVATNAVNNSYCIASDPRLAKISSLRTFCGGGGEGTPNRGDSGGGFFHLFGSAWVQHGIVSSINTNETGHVTAYSFAVYTNIKFFKNWIVDIVGRSGGEISEPRKLKINLECDYEFTVTDFSYGCWLFGFDIRNQNVEVASFTGSHIRGKSYLDVEVLIFENGTMFYIPNGIGEIFKNVRNVAFKPSLGTTIIRRSNLKNLKRLVDIQFLKNDVEAIEDDVLWDLPNLENFVLKNNNLKAISETTFDKNLRLRKIILSKNLLELLPKNLLQNNLLLEIVDFRQNLLKRIDEYIFVNNSRLREIYLNENALEFLPGNLFRNNFLLEKVFLFNNSIKAIDERTFGNATNVKEIYLSSNKLESLPPNLFQNNSLLEIVDFNNNFMKTLHERTFLNNLGLKEVILRSNHLDVLPKNLLRNNKKLEKIYLSKNFLQTIDENIFVNNSKLKVIDLNSNQLELLPKNLFQNNTLLEHVSLSINLLKIIDERTFFHNMMLKQVSLFYNQLKVLPNNLFQNNFFVLKVSCCWKFSIAKEIT